MQEILRLLKRDWPFILLAALCFAVGIWAGENFPQWNPGLAQQAEKMVVDKFTLLAQYMKNAPLFMEILIIWGNNLSAAFMALVAGLLLPLFPLIMAFGNGLVVGLFQRYTELHHGVSLFNFYISLVPHGIFELPAFFLAVATGFRFGLIPYRLIRRYAKTKEHPPYFPDFLREMGYYGALIIGLLFIAAILESTVSPLLVKR